MTDTYTTARIPDEAVQAALYQIHAYDYQPDENDFSNMRDAIKSALPHLSAPCAVEVKKLGEWRRGYCDDCVTIEQASTGFGSVYQVRVLNGVVWLDFPDNKEQEFFDVKTAKAAAQADFDRRILSCVVTKPVDVAAVRKQCASLVEAQANAINLAGMDRDRSITKYLSSQKVTLLDAAEAIRALSAEPAQGEKWQDMKYAPKGYPTESAGCRGVSDWFLGRPSKKYRDAGASPIVVIRRRAWPQEDGWMDNGETYYVPDYFEGWMPLCAAPNTEVGKCS